MKKCYLIFIAAFLLSPFAYAQNATDTAFHIEKFPEDGLVLDHNWTFYPKDDFNNAKPGYNAGPGITVNPALQLNQLPVVERSGIGWFRLTMQVDSSLRNKTIGMMLSLFGAAEIYLNGEKIYQFGEVSSNYKQEKTQAIFGRALSITLGNEEKQVLAVRYSHHPDNLYIKTGVGPRCLQIIFQSLNETIDRYAILVKRAYQFIGIALTIELASALLTLFFFFSFRSRKEYLYFGLYFCFNFFGVLALSDLAGVGKDVQLSANHFAFIQMMLYLFLITGSLFHLNAMYALLQKKKTRYYRFLFWYAIVAIVTLPFLPGWGSGFPDLFFPLVCFEMLPTYYKAARRNFRGAWILFISILICFLFLLALVKGNSGTDSGAVIVLSAFALLSPALGIVIFLAVDFARTSLSLKLRVVQVEALSQKTLAQERDKQEILAAQKDKLEVEV
ncbi:MAG: hypothetical protein M3Y85_04010, partial [Bacteroidota bacterium]|nr:hypothetical protein [Bacteroidota bacterium]